MTKESKVNIQDLQTSHFEQYLYDVRGFRLSIESFQGELGEKIWIRFKKESREETTFLFKKNYILMPLENPLAIKFFFQWLIARDGNVTQEEVEENLLALNIIERRFGT